MSTRARAVFCGRQEKTAAAMARTTRAVVLLALGCGVLTLMSVAVVSEAVREVGAKLIKPDWVM